MYYNDRSTKIFFDTEFSDLKQDAELISIGMITEHGDKYYLELSFDESKASGWVKEHVIPYLSSSEYKSPEYSIHRWLQLVAGASPTCKVTMISDCYAYDWVLFCALFEEGLPGFINYIPVDLATLFYAAGADPDVGREEFAGVCGADQKHNSMWDAEVIKRCFDKLLALKHDKYAAQ